MGAPLISLGAVALAVASVALGLRRRSAETGRGSLSLERWAIALLVVACIPLGTVFVPFAVAMLAVTAWALARTSIRRGALVGQVGATVAGDPAP